MAGPLKKDVNKYSKNADIKADTLAKTLLSIGGIVLMLVGIAGIAMEFFKENGWLKIALKWIFETTTHMMVVPVIIFLLWLFNHWISSNAKNEQKKSGDLPMYIMMAIGLFYVFQFISTGSL